MATEKKRYIVTGVESEPTVTDVKVLEIAGINPLDDETGVDSSFGERVEYVTAERTNGDGDFTISARGEVEPGMIPEIPSGSYPNLFGVPCEKQKALSGSVELVNAGSLRGSSYVWKPDTQDQYLLRETYNGFQKVSNALVRNYQSSSTQKSFQRPSALALKNGNLLTAFLDNEYLPWHWTYRMNMLDGGSPSQQIRNSPTGFNRFEVFNFYLVSPKDRLARTVRKATNSMIDNIDLTMDPDTLDLFIGYTGVTGFDLVQYQDTEETLMVYCGFLGPAGNHTSPSSPHYNPGYLCVDQITTPLDYTETTTTDPIETSNRAKVQINFRSQGAAFEPITGRAATMDVPGLEDEHFRPLDLCAEVLPSGRLVVVIAYEDAVYSLVSDDRGRTFQASQVMDLTFNDENFVQRCATVSSTMLDSGSMALLVTANGIGDRAGKVNEKAVDVTHGTETDPVQQSVISIFVSSDGVNWGTEKRLGQGAYDPLTLQTDTSFASAVPWPNDFLSYNAESVYAISGDIVQTPDGNILVSVIPMSLGGPGNGAQQGIYQRVLGVSELNQGQTGDDVAPSWPPIINHPDYAIGAKTTKFQPAHRVNNNFLDLTLSGTDNASDIIRRWANFTSYGNRTFADPGRHTNNVLCAQPLRTSYYSPMSYGGGPMWCMGPNDLTTIVWRDTVVTLCCQLVEINQPLGGFPNSDIVPNNAANTAPISPSTPDLSTITAKSALDRSVNIMYSGGWTPAYVRRPTELRYYSKFAQPCGQRTSTYGENLPALPAGAAWSLFSHYLGSNAYQVSFFAPESPDYRTWLNTANGGGSYSGVNIESNGKIVFIGRRMVANVSTNYRYIDYLGQLSAANKELYFPNSKGEMLPEVANVDQTYITEDVKGALAFVCRFVFRLSGGDVSVKTPGVGHAGVSIFLREKDGNQTKYQGLTLSCSGNTAGSSYSVALDPFNPSGTYGARLGTVSVTSGQGLYDPVGSSHDRRPFCEVIFGFKRDADISTTTLYPFLMARNVDYIRDPDMLGDFTVATGMASVTPTTDNVNTFSEYLRIGTFTTPSETITLDTQSFQFSRIFLNTQTTDGRVFDNLDDIPLGDNYWDESAHIGESASLQAVKFYNGGVFAPMAPSKATAKYQTIERGAEISIAGRATESASMVYKGATAFPVANIFKTPIMAGFRGSLAKITRSSNRISPPIEITLDFGEPGISPEAFTIFGCNSPDVMMQFTDDLALEPFGAGPTNAKPSFTMLCGNPLGEAYRINHALMGDPAENSSGGHDPYYVSQPFVFKPRYESLVLYKIMNNAGTGAVTAPSTFKLRPYFTSRGPGRFIRVYSSVGDSRNKAPFRPHQFKSSEKESFYVQIFKEASFAAHQAWQCLDDPLQRMTPDNTVFKIKDNGQDWIELTSDWTTQDADTRASFVIYSDRFGFNFPRAAFGDRQSYGTYASAGGNVPYRYVKLTLGGAVFKDPDENFIKLNALIMGRRIELSTRDISAGYSYEVSFGNELYTGLSGARRNRKNSEPRKAYTFSYEPRQSAPSRVNDNLTTTTDANVRGVGYDNPYRGYGEVYAHYENSEQVNDRSMLSWEEIVERVFALGVNGDVCALVFDGDGMVMNNLNTVNPITAGATITKAASDPHSMIPARLTGFGGASNEAYFGHRQSITDGSSLVTIDADSTVIKPKAIMSVKSLKFEEEL